VRAVLLADTHVRRGANRRLSDAAYGHLLGADVILHAGDVLVPELLDELAGFAPVHAVLGNNDHELVGILPERWVEAFDGVVVAMVHDSGPTNGRPARLRRWFPEADVVVFGHSHAPVIEEGLDGQLLVNPGSATERRRAPSHTLALLDLRAGSVAATLVEV
jgi:uncharacterized protein